MSRLDSLGVSRFVLLIASIVASLTLSVAYAEPESKTNDGSALLSFSEIAKLDRNSRIKYIGDVIDTLEIKEFDLLNDFIIRQGESKKEFWCFEGLFGPEARFSADKNWSRTSCPRNDSNAATFFVDPNHFSRWFVFALQVENYCFKNGTKETSCSRLRAAKKSNQTSKNQGAGA